MDWLASLDGLQRLDTARELNPLPTSQWGHVLIPDGLETGSAPWPHETPTMQTLATFGLDVEYIIRSRERGASHADIWLSGRIWEMKSPTGSGKNNINNTYKSAHGQSRSVVIDLARTPLDQIEYANSGVRRLPRSTHYDEFIILFKDGAGIHLARDATMLVRPARRHY